MKTLLLNMQNLEGVKGGRRKGAWVPTISALAGILRRKHCATMAGDSGALNIYLNDTGQYHCEFSANTGSLWIRKRCPHRKRPANGSRNGSRKSTNPMNSPTPPPPSGLVKKTVKARVFYLFPRCQLASDIPSRSDIPGVFIFCESVKRARARVSIENMTDEQMIEQGAKAVYDESYGWTTPWGKIHGSARTECMDVARAVLTSLNLLSKSK